MASGGTAYYYINGTQVDSFSYTGGSLQSTWTNKIGALQDSGGIRIFTTGFIDDVKIYPYARTAAQIKSDYASRGSVKGTSASMGSNAKNSSAFSNGLVGYWKLDETASPALDSSGVGSTGAWNGNVSGVAGMYGIGASFDGNGDYINVGDPSSGALDFGTGDFSIAAWFYLPSLPGSWASIVNKGASGATGYGLTVSNANQLSADIQGDSGNNQHAQSSATAVTAGVWQHGVAVFDRDDKIHVYLNGELKYSESYQSGNTNSVSNSGNFTIGIFNNGSSFPLNGKIDEVRTYNRALSPKEVRDLYNWAPGPRVQLAFDEGSGNPTDISGNGHSTSLTGSPSRTAGKFGKALDFDGTDDFGQITLTSDLTFAATNSFTVSTWFKSPTASTSHINAGIVGNYNTTTTPYWNLLFHDNGGNAGKVSFYIRDSGSLEAYSISTSRIDNNQWHHLTAVRDTFTDKIYLYIDGVLVDSDTDTTTATINSTQDIWLGNHLSRFYPHQMDDLKIYNYARTQKQIVEDMNAGHPAVGSPVGSAVGHWKFDEGYGQTANNSGSQVSALNGTLGANSGVSTDDPSWSQSGKFGKALSFDGINDYATLPDVDNSTDFAYNQDFSVSFWVNDSGGNANGDAIVEKWAGGVGGYAYVFRYNSQNSVSMARYDGTNNPSTGSTKTINDGKWHHVTGVKNGSTLLFYMDGTQSSTAADSTTGTTTNSSAIYLGSRGGTSQYYAGIIDEVKVYNYALTADEVKLDYNQGAAMVMGTISVNTGNTAPSSAASQEYCVPGDSTSCAPPVGEWTFNEGIGSTINDTSGHGITGTYYGSSTTRFNSGKVGKAGVFNSANTDYVDLGVQSSLTPNNITLEAWVKANSLGSWNGIISNMPSWGTGFSLQIGSVQKIAAMVSGTYLNSSTVPTTGRWYHIVATHDGSTNLNILYVNGREENRSTQAVSYSASARTEIGVFYTSPSLPFDGLIDQVRIYDYARSPAQVAWDFNRGAPVGWWKFDEGQGTTAYDSTGNGNNGNINIGASGTQTTAGTITSPTDGTGAWYNGRTGKLNYSLNFDGTDDYVSTTLVQNYVSEYTIASLVKTTAPEGIIAQDRGSGAGNSIILYWGTSGCGTPAGVLVGGFDTDGTCLGQRSTTTINDGNWHHVAVSWKGTSGQAVTPSQFTIYIDGIAPSMTSVDNGGARPNAPLTGLGGTRIGHHQAWGKFTNGQIDDVRIYNYALTPTQIRNLYNCNAAICFAPATGAP